ncbi:Uncharacterised protein [Mycobacterium tuberculosis]|nr:Uncharacterised protein [Mycobacterium tuberculosis]
MAERRGERLRRGPAGFGGGHQRRGRGHVRVAGPGAHEHRAQRLDQRETRDAALDRLRRPCGTRPKGLGLVGRFVGVQRELWFMPAPGSGSGTAFRGFQRLDRQIHRQRRRRQRDRVCGGHGQLKDGGGRLRAYSILE